VEGNIESSIEEAQKAFLSKPTKQSKESVQHVEENFESISMDVSLERTESVTIEKLWSMVGKRV